MSNGEITEDTYSSPEENSRQQKKPATPEHFHSFMGFLLKPLWEIKYWFLLATLVNMLLVPTLFTNPEVRKLVMEIAISLVLLASVNFFWHLSRWIMELLIFAAIAVAFNWIAFLVPGEIRLQGVRNLGLAGFFLILFYQLVRQVVRSPLVDAHVITGAVSAYLLLGIIGASLVMEVDILYPASFNVPMHPNEALFFSFTTITTTGYGNIYPLKAQAQAFSYFLAIAGQIYMTVLVAIIIGKYLLHSALRKHQ
jgi:voltage-gated potassium channel